MSEPLHGIYRARVVDVRDPRGARRLRLVAPQILGTSATNWAEPSVVRADVFQVDTSTGGGAITSRPAALPAVGSTVFLFFVGGDPSSPAYLA